MVNVSTKATQIPERRRQLIDTPLTLTFRFKSVEHRKLIQQAAEDSGLSINAWIVQATLQKARLQLKESQT